VAALLSVGALTAPAVYAGTVYHQNGGQNAVMVSTSNNNYTVNVKDLLGDGRWVQGKWLTGAGGTTEYYLSNKSGPNTTLSKTVTQKITSIKACYAGTLVQPMYCSGWKPA
jgi:hypothetical protein